VARGGSERFGGVDVAEGVENVEGRTDAWVVYMDPNLDLAVDLLLLTTGTGTEENASGSLIPDYLVLRNWSGVLVDRVDGANTQTHPRTSMKADIDRLRVSARGSGIT
jgi:hypothetical protein